MSQQLNDLQHERYEANVAAVFDCVIKGVHENHIAQLVSELGIDAADRKDIVQLMQQMEQRERKAA